MMNTTITSEQISKFEMYLKSQDRCPGTRDKYLRDVRNFASFLGEKLLNREAAAAWRDALLHNHYAPVTINSMIASLNGYFRFIGREDCCLRFLKIQRKLFRESTKELTRAEYDRLIDSAYAEEPHIVPKTLIKDFGTRGMQTRAVPRSAAYVRHSRYPIRYGCKDLGDDDRSRFGGNDAEYLLTHNGRNAEECRTEDRPNDRRGDGRTGIVWGGCKWRGTTHQ